MAQSVIARPDADNIVFGTAAWVDISGMVVNLLQGSGWIRLDYQASVENTTGGPLTGIIRPLVDGVDDPLNQRAAIIPANGIQVISGSTILKPGSGQKAYKMQGFGSAVGLRVNLRRACLIVTEPGY